MIEKQQTLCFDRTNCYNFGMKIEKDSCVIQSLVACTSTMPSANSMAAYLNWANSVPMLSAEDELRLAKRLRDHNDVEAAKALILPHIRYVARIARDLMGYGLAYADLVQEGTIGLMKAVKRFDPDQGVRLATYATHWIKSEMHEFIIRNWRIVKIATTKAQRKLFFNLRKQKKRLGWHTEAEVQADKLPNIKGVVFKMEQLFTNLISNALKYTEKGSVSLTLSLVKKEGRQVVLSFVIADTGFGIPVEKQALLYEKENHLGSPSLYLTKGLGFRIVKNFLDALDGDIYVENHAVQGSVVKVLIPYKLLQ